MNKPLDGSLHHVLSIRFVTKGIKSLSDFKMKESALVVLLLLLPWEVRSGLNSYKKSENRPSSLNFINGDTKLVNKLSSHPHSIISEFQHELERKVISESPPAEDVPSLPPYDLLPKQPTAENGQPSRYDNSKYDIILMHDRSTAH